MSEIYSLIIFESASSNSSLGSKSQTLCAIGEIAEDTLTAKGGIIILFVQFQVYFVFIFLFQFLDVVEYSFNAILIPINHLGQV